jgi:hypothetical protein
MLGVTTHVRWYPAIDTIPERSGVEGFKLLDRTKVSDKLNPMEFHNCDDDRDPFAKMLNEVRTTWHFGN